jgi:hypothetical protein
MGVLGNQPVRDSFPIRQDYLDAFLAGAAKLAMKHSTTIESVIEAKRVLEMERRNSILSLAGDYHDEQMGGLGEILTRIADALENKE